MSLALSTFCIITCVFLFLVRLRFPAQDPIIKILQRCHGDGLVKKVWKLEKFDFKSRKALLDLEFLQSYEAYLSCQRHLLDRKISIKCKTIWTICNKITLLKIVYAVK